MAKKKVSPKKKSSVQSQGSEGSSRGKSVDGWPKTREVLFRPERFKYVRKIDMPKECIFCRAKNEGVSFETLCVYRDEHAIIVLNKYPYNSGHIMVVPARHVGNLSELSEKEHLHVQKLLHKVVQVAQKEYQCGGMNIGLNMGAIAGAGLPDHLHWHVVPRWAGDTNFFPLIADTKVNPESLEQAYEKYKKHFA